MNCVWVQTMLNNNMICLASNMILLLVQLDWRTALMTGLHALCDLFSQVANGGITIWIAMLLLKTSRNVFQLLVASKFQTFACTCGSQMWATESNLIITKSRITASTRWFWTCNGVQNVRFKYSEYKCRNKQTMQIQIYIYI